MGHKTGGPTGTDGLTKGRPLFPGEIRWWKRTIFTSRLRRVGQSKAFSRNVFFLPNDKETGPLLVQYLGDSSASKVFAQKNAKPDKAIVFVRSKPSEIKDWRAKVENTDAYVVCKNEITKRTIDEDPIEQEMVGKPRNVEQLRNLKKKINRQQRLTWYEIYNVHKMAWDMDNFVHHITTFRDMVIICGLKQVLEEVELVLGDGGIDQILSYDTTFTMGDFYVSILIFRQRFFLKNPCIPALFLIHERKYEECHKKLFHILDKLVKFPRGQKIACVTDGERGIVNSVQSLPQLVDVCCWNHVFNDVKGFVTKNGGRKEEAKVYMV